MTRKRTNSSVFSEAPLASEFEQATSPIAFCTSALPASTTFLHCPLREWKLRPQILIFWTCNVTYKREGEKWPAWQRLGTTSQDKNLVQTVKCRQEAERDRAWSLKAVVKRGIAIKFRLWITKQGCFLSSHPEDWQQLDTTVHGLDADTFVWTLLKASAKNKWIRAVRAVKKGKGWQEKWQPPIRSVRCTW